MDLRLIWNSLAAFCKRAERLLLYYVLKDGKTTAIHKHPILGWTDVILSIKVVYDRMHKYITPDMLRRADAQLDKWIPTI